MRWLVVLPFLAGCLVSELTVEKRGDGEGRVVSDPAGIDCGKTCGTPLPGRSILTAIPAAGSVFTGWGGACSGTEACEVDVGDDDVAVVASFALIDEPLTIRVTGEGSVMSEPAGIDCGAECAVTFKHGTRVKLRAQPAPGLMVASWGDAECSAELCVLDLVEPRTIDVVFLGPQTLVATTDGPGDIVSDPSGLDATHTMATFPPYSTVVLHALAHQGASFTAWGGACAGVQGLDCVVRMDRPLGVSASFGDPPPPNSKPCTVTVSTSQSASSLNGLLTSGAVVCLEHGVSIIGYVRIQADDVTIRGIGGLPLPRLMSDDVTVLVDPGQRAGLANLDISSTGDIGEALELPAGGSVYVIDSVLSCDRSQMPVVQAYGASVTITGSSIVAGDATQRHGDGLRGGNGGTITIRSTSIEAYGYAAIVGRNATLDVKDSTLRGLSEITPIEFSDVNTTMTFKASTVLSTGPYAIEIPMSVGLRLVLDGTTFRKTAGSPPGASSPIRSYSTNNVIDAPTPNTFCNEGTATDDGEWVAPLLEGTYAPSSTFGNAANVGPIDCP